MTQWVLLGEKLGCCCLLFFKGKSLLCGCDWNLRPCVFWASTLPQSCPASPRGRSWDGTMWSFSCECVGCMHYNLLGLLCVVCCALYPPPSKLVVLFSISWQGSWGSGVHELCGFLHGGQTELHSGWFYLGLSLLLSAASFGGLQQENRSGENHTGWGEYRTQWSLETGSPIPRGNCVDFCSPEVAMDLGPSSLGGYLPSSHI